MSAVITLAVDGVRQVTWAGDAQFSVVAATCKGAPGHLLVGPHHGAPTDHDHARFPDNVQAHRPDRVWISVGTGNSYGHPNADYLERHTLHGSYVCCSQLVHCDAKRVAAQSHVTEHHWELQLPPPFDSRGVHCRGPLRLEWDPDKQRLLPDPQLEQEHQERIRMLAKPLCVRRDPSGAAVPVARP